MNKSMKILSKTEKELTAGGVVHTLHLSTQEVDAGGAM